MAADTPFVGTEAAGALAAQVKKRLLTVTEMPASPSHGDLVLWNGAESGGYTKGMVYKYQSGLNDWVRCGAEIYTITEDWGNYVKTGLEAAYKKSTDDMDTVFVYFELGLMPSSTSETPYTESGDSNESAYGMTFVSTLWNSREIALTGTEGNIFRLKWNGTWDSSGTYTITSLTVQKVISDTVAPALADVTIENFKTSITPESGVTVIGAEFVQKGLISLVSITNMLVSEDKSPHATLFTLPATVPAAKINEFCSMYNSTADVPVLFYVNRNRQVRTRQALSAGTFLSGTLLYV